VLNFLWDFQLEVSNKRKRMDEEGELCPKCRNKFPIMELIEHSGECKGVPQNDLPVLQTKDIKSSQLPTDVLKTIKLEQLESNKICTECGEYGRRANSNFCTKCGGLLRERSDKENKLKKKEDKKDKVLKEIQKDLAKELANEKKMSKKVIKENDDSGEELP
jgi:hypothetical protein